MRTANRRLTVMRTFGLIDNNKVIFRLRISLHVLGIQALIFETSLCNQGRDSYPVVLDLIVSGEQLIRAVEVSNTQITTYHSLK